MAFAVILSVFTLASAAVFMSLSATVKAAEQNNVSNLNIQDVTAVLNHAVEQQNAARGFASSAEIWTRPGLGPGFDHPALTGTPVKTA